jgi:drug/metabolite transporter (DMT)-like permease
VTSSLNSCVPLIYHLVVKAFSLTTITAAMILNVFTIPSALLLSKVILKVKFRSNRYCFAVGMSLAAVSVIFIHDILMDDGTKVEISAKAVFGDFLVILASFLLAL